MSFLASLGRFGFHASVCHLVGLCSFFAACRELTFDLMLGIQLFLMRPCPTHGRHWAWPVIGNPRLKVIWCTVDVGLMMVRGDWCRVSRMLDDLRLQKYLIGSYLVEADLVVIELFIWVENPHLNILNGLIGLLWLRRGGELHVVIEELEILRLNLHLVGLVHFLGFVILRGVYFEVDQVTIKVVCLLIAYPRHWGLLCLIKKKRWLWLRLRGWGKFQSLRPRDDVLLMSLEANVVYCLLHPRYFLSMRVRSRIYRQ